MFTADEKNILITGVVYDYNKSYFIINECILIIPGLMPSLLLSLYCIYTAWKVSKYGVISGPYFPVFSPNTGKYEPEITPYLDTFHAVSMLSET